MYEILGGTHRACLNWQEAGLMGPDHVHYLPDGYRLQGELFCQALLKLITIMWNIDEFYPD